MNDNLTQAEWADAAFLIYTKPAPPPFKFFFLVHFSMTKSIFDVRGMIPVCPRVAAPQASFGPFLF